MILMKRMKVRGLCLVGLGLMSTLAFGLAGSASAAPLLFKPANGIFPYHFTGTGGETILETLSGKKVEAASTDIQINQLNSTLFDLHIEFLKLKAEATACKNEGKAEAVLMNLLGHLGLADPGNKPAVLLLVPTGFEFECAFGIAKEKLRGELIGEITSPGLSTGSELESLSFVQSKGMQALSTFLLGSETLTNQFEEISLNGGAFEGWGQLGAADLKAVAGEGKFELVSP
jgi:hypothetical protein